MGKANCQSRPQYPKFCKSLVQYSLILLLTSVTSVASPFLPVSNIFVVQAFEDLTSYVCYRKCAGTWIPRFSIDCHSWKQRQHQCASSRSVWKRGSKLQRNRDTHRLAWIIGLAQICRKPQHCQFPNHRGSTQQLHPCWYRAHFKCKHSSCISTRCVMFSNSLSAPCLTLLHRRCADEICPSRS